MNWDFLEAFLVIVQYKIICYTKKDRFFSNVTERLQNLTADLGQGFFLHFSGIPPDKRKMKFFAEDAMGILHKANRFLPLFMKKRKDGIKWNRV
jgi:hypothetical protein